MSDSNVVEFPRRFRVVDCQAELGPMQKFWRQFHSALSDDAIREKQKKIAESWLAGAYEELEQEQVREIWMEVQELIDARGKI